MCFVGFVASYTLNLSPLHFAVSISWSPRLSTDLSLTPLAAPVPFAFLPYFYKSKSSELEGFISSSAALSLLYSSTNRIEKFIDTGSKADQKENSGPSSAVIISEYSCVLWQGSEQAVLQLCRPLFLGGVFWSICQARSVFIFYATLRMVS